MDCLVNIANFHTTTIAEKKSFLGISGSRLPTFA